MDIGEASLDAVVVVGESFVIDTEELQDCGMVVIPMHGLVNSFPADFVGGAPVDA